MRRTTILLTALPLANALSLANFQDITSVLIPTACLLAYDQQIAVCKVADFESPGCSVGCQAQLTAVSKVVIKACSNVFVNSNTLLGIVKSGKILGALCPAFPNASAPTTPPPTLTPPPQTTPPTDTKKSTSSSSRQAQSATETPDQSRTRSSTEEPVTQPTDNPTAEPTPPQPSPFKSLVTISTKSTTSAASTTSPVRNKNTSGGLDTGGGSPFDISGGKSSSTAPQVSQNPILAIIIAIGAVMLTVR